MNIERPNRIWLPRTGQTVVDTAGDDGSCQAGNPRVTRYVNNGNNTVSDLAAGLMWVRDHDAMGAPFNGTMNWADALANIATLNGSGYAGHTDWRLPNIIELHSLSDVGFYNPAIDTSIFPNAKGSRYWSGTSAPTATGPSATLALALFLVYGMTELQAKTSTYYVRPVRGGRLNG